MAEYETVGRAEDIPEGGAAAFSLHGRMIGVFNLGGEFYAIDDFCPHMGASLSEGHVEDGVVACPWHAWQFSVRDGSWADNPRIKIDRFDVRVQDGEIQVRVAEQQRRDAEE